MLAAWLVNTPGGECVVPAAVFSANAPPEEPARSLDGVGVSLLSMLSNPALLSCSTAQGPVVPALSSGPPPLSLAHRPACTSPAGPSPGCRH